MKGLHMTAFVLMAIGAINWGLIGFFNFNIVNVIFSSMPLVENLVYILVGISGVYVLATHKKDCKICSKK